MTAVLVVTALLAFAIGFFLALAVVAPVVRDLNNEITRLRDLFTHERRRAEAAEMKNADLRGVLRTARELLEAKEDS